MSLLEILGPKVQNILVSNFTSVCTSLLFRTNRSDLDFGNKMASGVTVSEDVKSVYNELKDDKKHRYILFHIKDEKAIVVDKTGGRNKMYDDMLNNIKDIKGDCRYVVYDIPEEGSQDASETGTLVLMTWCPESAKVKRKMLYSSSFDALKKALKGVHNYIQATDIAEAELDAVKEKIAALKARK